jgi:hypothetical protein
LFVYIYRREQQINEFAGCYDCGWDMRQALLVVIGAFFLLFHRIWTAIVAFLAGLKVTYSIGYVVFLNNLMEVRGTWQIIRTSVHWAFELRPEHFIELPFALVIMVTAGCIIVSRLRIRASGHDGIEQIVGPERG